ncbi:sigma-70 family RNA polymerase sigma factor [Planctomicrobium sp. SH664]|uniref:sigma-70 family RNA polymerase sigma factor n=1 Tax=Planctomicrobium sp. SH664 TaxID=3448125 RepID=UPI003F5C4BA2
MDKSGLEFSQLLLRNDRAMLRYIMTFVPRRDDAEEVLQRTAIALWEKFPEYDRNRDFLPWATRFAYLEVLNFRKDNARSRLVFNEEVMASLKDTQDNLDSILDAQHMALKQCLAEVDSRGLLLLQRRYCDSESIASLANETGKTVKALYRRLDRIRELVAKCVKQRMKAELS